MSEGDLSKCQYCFVSYDECTCCKHCGFIKDTCECYLEGEWPCTKVHPSDVYRTFLRHPECCNMFGYGNKIEDADKFIMRMYSKDVWPDRLKNG